MLAIQWGSSGAFNVATWALIAWTPWMRAARAGTQRSDQGIRTTFSDNGKGIEAPVAVAHFRPALQTKGDLGTGLGVARAPVPDRSDVRLTSRRVLVPSAQ